MNNSKNMKSNRIEYPNGNEKRNRAVRTKRFMQIIRDPVRPDVQWALSICSSTPPTDRTSRSIQMTQRRVQSSGGGGVVPNFRMTFDTASRGVLLNPILPDSICSEGQPPIVEWMWMVLEPLSCSFWCLPYARPVDHSSIHLPSQPFAYPHPKPSPKLTYLANWTRLAGGSSHSRRPDPVRITRHFSTFLPAYAWRLGTP